MNESFQSFRGRPEVVSIGDKLELRLVDAAGAVLAKIELSAKNADRLIVDLVNLRGTL